MSSDLRHYGLDPPTLLLRIEVLERERDALRARVAELEGLLGDARRRKAEVIREKEE